MLDLIRESTVGELINKVSGGRLLPYPDQRTGFVIPDVYLATSSPASTSAPISRAETLTGGKPAADEANLKKLDTDAAPEPERTNIAVEKVETWDSDVTLEAGPSGVAAEAHVDTKGYQLVDWYSETDPENPRNWSFAKRAFVMFEICLLTFSVYIGSAIYTASTPYVMEEFGVSNVVATLGLSLFIEGYAIGPLLLSPLQELPSLGRNPVYIITIVLFAIIQIPTALGTNIGGLLVLRFLAGFLGSPALATGGASIGDIFPQSAVPFAIGLWAMAAVCGPVLGPIVGGFAAAAESWRWPLWELGWVSGFAAIFLAFFLPETLPDTILLKRAQRLRRLTGNENLRSLSEIKQAEMKPSEVAKEYLIRPFQLMVEPAVLFINLYLGLAYAIFYLWFEAFPLVFIDIYHFQGGIAGLPFVGILIGAIVSYIFYTLYLTYYLYPKFAKTNWTSPAEEWLRLALIASVFIPISLFIFGWTSRPNVHWIVPIIGASLYVPGLYLLFQSALVYLPVSYPHYVASILAGNDFFRSSVAAAFPLFGRAYFTNVGLGAGSSALAGIAIAMIPFLYALMRWGGKLRAMSRYAQ